MIPYINADIGQDGRIRVRIKAANHFVITVWECDRGNWLICDCRDIGAHIPGDLTQEGVGYYSVIGARIVKTMTEGPE